MAADFASQASVALELAAGRVDRQRLAILEDRSRIARDLHDNVIQRLFGAGMSLQAVSGAIPDLSVRSLIAQQVQALDAAISEIRAAVFTLNAERSESPSLRHRVIDMLGEMENMFIEQPRVTFSGAVDLMIDDSLADDVVAVIREGLCNIARHARATHILISVTVEASQATVRLEDDGEGVPRMRTRSSGTANLAARASARGGRFSLERRVPCGTELLWDVPLSIEETP
jgi:signal transduction histidine kinase